MARAALALGLTTADKPIYCASFDERDATVWYVVVLTRDGMLVHISAAGSSGWHDRADGEPTSVRASLQPLSTAVRAVRVTGTSASDHSPLTWSSVSWAIDLTDGTSLDLPHPRTAGSYAGRETAERVAEDIRRGLIRATRRAAATGDAS